MIKSDQLDVIREDLEALLAAGHQAVSLNDTAGVQTAWQNIQAVAQLLIARLLFEIASDLSAIREAVEAEVSDDTEASER